MARNQADRGRQASKPTEIPAKGWKTSRCAPTGYRENRDHAGLGRGHLLRAAGDLPAVAALGVRLRARGRHLDHQPPARQPAGILPQGALDIVGEQIKALDAKGNATLGLSLIIVSPCRVERQRRHEAHLRCAQPRLQRAREAQFSSCSTSFPSPSPRARCCS